MEMTRESPGVQCCIKCKFWIADDDSDDVHWGDCECPVWPDRRTHWADGRKCEQSKPLSEVTP